MIDCQDNSHYFRESVRYSTICQTCSWWWERNVWLRQRVATEAGEKDGQRSEWLNLSCRVVIMVKTEKGREQRSRRKKALLESHNGGETRSHIDRIWITDNTALLTMDCLSTHTSCFNLHIQSTIGGEINTAFHPIPTLSVIKELSYWYLRTLAELPIDR